MTQYYFFSLSRTPLPSMFTIPFSLRGREELLALLCTWVVPSFCCKLFLGTGLQTLLTRSRSTRKREAGIIPGSTGNRTKRRSRTRITVAHCIGIPGHCMVVIPGHCVNVFLCNCLSGGYTRWLVRMWGHVSTAGDFRATVRSQ